MNTTNRKSTRDNLDLSANKRSRIVSSKSQSWTQRPPTTIARARMTMWRQRRNLPVRCKLWGQLRPFCLVLWAISSKTRSMRRSYWSCLAPIVAQITINLKNRAAPIANEELSKPSPELTLRTRSSRSRTFSKTWVWQKRYACSRRQQALYKSRMI